MLTCVLQVVILCSRRCLELAKMGPGSQAGMGPRWLVGRCWLIKKKISLAGLMAVAQPANAWPQGLVACHVFRCFLGLFWALQTFSGCFRCFGPFMGISRRFWCFLVFPGCFGPFLGGVFLAVLMFSGLSWVFWNLWAAFSGRFWCFLAFSGGFGLFVGISGVFGVFWPFLGVSGCLGHSGRF